MTQEEAVNRVQFYDNTMYIAELACSSCSMIDYKLTITEYDI